MAGLSPKVIWIQLGNRTTDDVARLRRDAQSLIAAFVAHPDAAFLPLRTRDA